MTDYLDEGTYQPTDVLEMAFMVIANVWDQDQTEDWKRAKRRFINAYHQWLDEGMPGREKLPLVDFDSEE